jgi:hypothetical protein
VVCFDTLAVERRRRISEAIELWLKTMRKHSAFS